MRALVIGAGPAGSTAAAYLAAAGIQTHIVEKTYFPREKVCGDGLTPRAVKELQLLGVDHSGSEWQKVRGLRLSAGERTVQVPFPQLRDFPDYGLVRTRFGFDQTLMETAVAAGATIDFGRSVASVIRDDNGRISGVRAAVLDQDGRKTGEDQTYSADIVLVADGNSSPTAKAAGVLRRTDRPLGVAVRTYYRSAHHELPFFEAWLQLQGQTGPLPGYGWVFGVGDGTCNVGLGILNSNSESSKLDLRSVLSDWAAALPGDWDFNSETQEGPIRGSALPMGFNRTPHFQPGLALLGDAGGMVSPFNGEGISYAMESGRLAAERLIPAAILGDKGTIDAAAYGYAEDLRTLWGKHYTLGRVFADLIGKPRIMSLALKAGFSVPGLMSLTAPMLANLTDRSAGRKAASAWLLETIEAFVPATSTSADKVKM